MKYSEMLIILVMSVIGISTIYLVIRDPQKQTVIEEIINEAIINSEPIEPSFTPITLDKIFDGIDAQTSDSSTWSLLVGGDVMIGRTVNYKTLVYNDFDWPYKNISSLLGDADLAYVNLESPVVQNCPTRNDGMIFCGNVNHIAAIKRSGIDIVSLANNHMLNQGQQGLEETLLHLQLNDLIGVGAPNPSYIDVNGTQVAMLAYTDIECYPGVECVNEEKIKSDIASAKTNSDLVIIMYHWGAEYRDYPTQRQIDVAHMSIDAGADLILGNHPHWIQPFEIYKDKLIMYSHGNLVFDQMWSQKTREGVLVEYIFNRNQLIDAQIHPVLIEDFGQPQIVEGEARTSKIEFIRNISENLSSGNY